MRYYLILQIFAWLWNYQRHWLIWGIISLSHKKKPILNNFHIFWIRWFLYACGLKKDSIWFFMNGIAMTFVFFLVRISIIPIYWYKVYYILIIPLNTNTTDEIEIEMNKFLYIMIVTCMVLDIINIFWFIKIFKGATIVTLDYFKSNDKNILNEPEIKKNN